MSCAVTVAGLARVKNEADVIEAFVRHHTALLDHVVVVDNASADGTRNILDALVEEGLPITVLDDATFVYRQSEIMTFLTRAAFAELGCERLFLLDADEFLIADAGRTLDRGALDAALGRLAWETHGTVPWVTYVPTGADDPEQTEPLSRIVHRRVREAVVHQKLAVSASFLRDPDAVVEQGNHAVSGRPSAATADALPGVALAHFPARSMQQLASKVLVGWNAYLAMGYGDAGLAKQWQYAYEAVMQRGGMSAQMYLKLAAGYPGEPIDPSAVKVVRAPFPAPALRYAHLRVPDPTVVVAKALEQLSRQFAAATAAYAERAKNGTVPRRTPKPWSGGSTASTAG